MKSYIFILILIFLSLESCNSVTSGITEQVVRPPKLPTNVTFAGERVPLEDQDVLERLDREMIVNQNYHSATILIYKNVKRYKEPIEKILKENGIPEDFFYLAVAESALNPNATSSANAAGLWQFIQGTAEGYGLEVSNYADERRHFIKSTRAACKYLLDAYKEFGNWTLVAAAYNRGQRGIFSLPASHSKASLDNLSSMAVSINNCFSEGESSNTSESFSSFSFVGAPLRPLSNSI
jgi:hypothetical protein